MLEGFKELLRKQSLKKYASSEPTGFLPLDKIRSAVAFIDVEDTSYDLCKVEIMNFFRSYNIKVDIFFIDFRKLTDGERLITSITTTVLKKDLNWFGRPSREKIDLMLEGNPDLFLSMFPRDEYAVEFMAKCSKARFKIGRFQLPDNTFDLVIKDPAGRAYSEAEAFKEIAAFLRKIR